MLNSKQKKYLKGLAHHLKPVVQIGKDDLKESVVEAVKKELLHHELIKIKIGQNSGVNKKNAPEELAEAAGAEVVQLIGKTIILFKQNIKLPKDTRISLPK